jgi:hypothetical protein
VTFDYTNHLPIISILKPLVGQEGSLRLSLLTIESLDQVENYLIVAALADNGQSLDVEEATRLLQLPTTDCRHLKTSLMTEPLASVTMCRQEAILQSVSQRNAAFFEAEANKLDGWAEDLRVGLEREIKELDRQISYHAPLGHHEARKWATATPAWARRGRMEPLGLATRSCTLWCREPEDRLDPDTSRYQGLSPTSHGKPSP